MINESGAGPCGPAPRTSIRARPRVRATRVTARRPDRIGSPAMVFGAPRCGRCGAPPASVSFAERDATPPPAALPFAELGRRRPGRSRRTDARADIQASALALSRCARRAERARGPISAEGFLARAVPARRSSLASRRSQRVRSSNGRRSGRRSRDTAATRRPSDVTGARSGEGSDRRRCSYVRRFELLLAAGQRPYARRTGADDGIRSARLEAERPPILSSAAPPPSLTIGDGLM
jgi:hypothetical protein